MSSTQLQSERNSFIKTFGGYFRRVLDSFGIADGDAAGTDRHTYGCYVIKGHTVMAVDSCAAADPRSAGPSADIIVRGQRVLESDFGSTRA
jgi:hypothetical protein